MRTALRPLAVCLALLLFALPSRAQTAGGSAYLPTWTETTGAPSGSSTLARPFRDAQGRVYVAETWQIPGGAPTEWNGPPGQGSRLHRWDGRRWSHLDVQFVDPYAPTVVRNAVVSHLAVIGGDTLVAATDYGPMKWTGAAWRTLYPVAFSALPRPAGAVNRLAYDATRNRLYVSGSDFSVSLSGGGLSILHTQRGVGYLDLATRRWKGIGGYANVTVNDLLLSPSGDLYAAGSFAAIGGRGAAGFEAYAPYVPATPARHVARFAPADSSWTALGGGPAPSAVQGTPFALRLGADGTPYAAGAYFATYGGALLPSVWRYDGAAWTAVDAPGQKPADAFELTPDGTPLIVTGQWTTHSARGSSWRWTGSAWEEVGGVLANFYAYGAYAYAGLYDLKLTRAYAWHFLPGRTCVYAEFEFAIASGPNGRRTGLACRASEAERWRLQLPTGVLSGPVTATGRTADGTLYAAGTFSQIGVLDASGVAVKVGEDWVPVDGGPAVAYANGDRGPLGRVYALTSDGAGGLFVGGSFTRVGGSATDNASHIARFTPGTTPGTGTWASVAGGVTGSAADAGVRFVVPGHGGVYVAGSFDAARPALTSTGSALVQAKGLAFWNGTAWESRAMTMSVGVAPLVGPDGALYVAGPFRNVSVSPTTGYAIVARGVAKYVPKDPADPYSFAHWADVGGGGLSDFDNASFNRAVMRSLAFGPGGQLCAGGTFRHTPGRYDGVPAGAVVQNLACWNGSQWLAPATPFPGNAPAPGDALTQGTAGTAADMPEVNALAGDGAALYVGGNALLMRYKDGVWTNLGGATPPTVTALALGPQGMEVMTAGGTVLSLTPAQLPVELTAFTALADGPGRLALAWTTASETNNAGFTVEYQTPGAASWTDGGFVPGRGTTTERHAYAHRLAGLAPGPLRLRLRQTDTDGTVHLSPVVEVEVSASDELALSVGPNPARSSATVRVHVPSAGPVRVAVYDVLGREVARLHDGEAAPGTLAFALPIQNWAAGVYTLRVETARERLTRALVVAR